ncbi:MAG: beta-ketoacyl-[acyl-carrier-protein] synthase II, partial [Anaerolineae bacterium]|nr:beta-ketoacyl-[acyl-carrier-protein] synthase II [Anaerolineae bacterium]
MATRPGMQRVVITGMGVASPLGCSLDEFWARLLAGDSGVRLLPEIDLTPCPTKIGAAVSGLDENAYFSHKERKRLSRSTLLGLVAADQAVEAAGGNLAKGDGHRRGVIMGSSIAGYTAAEPFFEEYFTGWRGSPYIIPKVMNNAPASNISIRHGFIGPLLTTDAACASAAHAVGYAFQQVRHGILDMALTGAADVA